MKDMIDETELARLEALAAHYANVVTLDNVSIPHKIIKSVPALVAEVRRLREALNKEHRAWQCADARGDWLEMENAALREKVEAWEWFGECRSLIVWRGPEDEMMEIFNAAREAVHVDRE